jgi:hypothetical protein
MRGFARSVIGGLLLSLIGSAAVAQSYALPDSVSASEELGSVTRQLLDAIEALTDYRAGAALPAVYQLPQPQLEALVCDEPCNVTAAFLPGIGIVLAQHLDPVREPRDRAALLHELVHALQQGHSRFAGMPPCVRERAKEQEAYAIQNAYLAHNGSSARVVFYDGDFDCGGQEEERAQ